MEIENTAEDRKYSYFQYFKSEGLPVYIKLILSDFNSDTLRLLQSMQFDEVEGEEGEARVLKNLKENPKAKLLNITLASPGVGRQIERSLESDKYGLESIMPREGYKVYRLKNMGLMVYAFTVQEWSLGCFEDFGAEYNLSAARTIMNRYLSWALFTQGIIGFWGVPVDEGMVLQRINDSLGEAVFFDVNNYKLYTVDGLKKVGAKFKFIKLDSALKGRDIYFTNEELYSALGSHCTFFNYEGLNTATRQMMTILCKDFAGYRHPKESFKPRSEV